MTPFQPYQNSGKPCSSTIVGPLPRQATLRVTSPTSTFVKAISSAGQLSSASTACGTSAGVTRAGVSALPGVLDVAGFEQARSDVTRRSGRNCIAADASTEI